MFTVSIFAKSYRKDLPLELNELFWIEKNLFPHIIYSPDYFMYYYSIRYMVNLFVKTKTHFSQLVVTSIYGLYSYI